MDCLVVDFQQVKSIEMDKIQTLSLEGQMEHPFVEQMMMRFTSYTSRIPVDRVDTDMENIYIHRLARGYKPKE
jgi:hypothetical protein